MNGNANGGSTGSYGSAVKRFTPPGLKEYDPGTELIFPPSLRKHVWRPIAFGNKKKRWLRPTTLQQLLEIKSASPSAKIIGGSTETQIESELGVPSADWFGDADSSLPCS